MWGTKESWDAEDPRTKEENEILGGLAEAESLFRDKNTDAALRKLDSVRSLMLTRLTAEHIERERKKERERLRRKRESRAMPQSLERNEHSNEDTPHTLE